MKRYVRIKAVKFFVTFFLILSVALVFAYQINDEFREIETKFIVRLTRALGLETSRAPPHKIFAYYPEGAFILEMTLSCSALFPIATFLFLVLLTPGISLRMKLLAGILTCLILYLLNALRVVLVFYAGKVLGKGAILLFHDWMGGAIMFFAALTSYSVWLFLVLTRPSEIKPRTLYPE